MKYTLRKHQETDIENLRASYRKGHRAVLYQLSTGGGKTVVGSFIIDGLARNKKLTWFLVHRQELLRQASGTLNEIGVSHGLIAPGFTPSFEQVQVASVQTLINRLDKVQPPDFIIVDEAHHCIKTTTWGKILNHYPKAKILGLTATPCRLSGEGLGVNYGGFFEDMVSGPPISELIKQKYLSMPRIIAPPSFDAAGMHKRYGEFVQKEVEAAMDKPVITGCAVEHYRKYSHNIPAIAFCASVAHAEHVAEQFRAAGYQSASIDGKLDDRARKSRIAALGSGALHVLTSCDLVSEGFDLPVIGTAILLRPTASLSLVLQQIGRALRIYPGKEYATILDHVGNTARHDLQGLGHPEWDIAWDLSGEVKKKKDGEKKDLIKQCSQCYAVHRPAPKCPMCGFVYEVQAREVEQVDGDLKEVTAAELETMRAAREKKRQVGRAQTFEELQAIEKQRGYKPGWARHVWAARGQRTGARL